MSTGNIKEKHPDIELIKSIKNVAEREVLNLLKIKQNTSLKTVMIGHYTNWKAFSLNFELHINVLKKEIEKKINESII